MNGKHIPRLFLVAALPATLVIASACGGDDDDDTDTTPSATSAAASATTPAERSPSPAASASTTTGAIKLTNPTTTPSGLKYEDTVVGNGKSPTNGRLVTVHYTGTLTNGKQFDSSRGKQPYSFVVGTGSVIAGWDEGILGMKVGGKRLLEIPPELGYGARDYGPIPGGSTLLFEVELLSVQ
jgi:peptidylprolyl isomerase